nr:PAS domain S-box protein [uncultured Methanoregula sp.]
MDRSVFTNLQKRPGILVLLIAAITIVTLVLNGYGLMNGITNVLPHIFYVPIILAAYFFPRRGIFFSLIISAMYCILVYYFNPVIPGDLIPAGGRVIIFILIATVVSFLTIRVQESTGQFQDMAERSSDIIILTDITGRATYVSPSVEKILGWERSDIIGKVPGDFIHPDNIDRLQASVLGITEGKIPVKITVPFRRKDGVYAILEFSGAPIIKDGVVAGIQVIGRDITERKREEETHRETSRRLAEIIEFLPDPTMVIDNAGDIVAWNRAMELMSGIPASDMIGKGGHSYTSWISGDTGPILIDYILRQDMEGIKTAYPDVRFEGNMVRTEKNVTRVDGTRFSLWISATPLIDREGRVTGAIESLRDVTSQKKIQRALRESNTYLDTVINTLADPLFIKDSNHNFVKVNNGFCQFTGHTREELLGKSDYDFFKREEADTFWLKDEEVFRTGRENENEEDITDSAENTHTISTKKILYTNSSGEKFIVGIIRDITERKKTEQALQQALRKLNMLSSITRHDILNQLMGLRTYLELAEEREKDPELLDYLKNTDIAADAIRRQIEFTRNYEDLGVQAPRWQDVAEIFRTAASQLPLGEIAVDTQVSGLYVYADPLIEKVFSNLMENTLRHGGHVTSVALSAEEVPDGLIVTYRDNGVGISLEDKTRLFQKGFGKHTGLGLFLSREILSITGISITENGKPGEGVRFEIRVPGGTYRFSGERN